MDTLGLNLPDLRVGARGPAVLAVHRQLARDGFYSSSIDGNFGPLTEKAVRAFQRSHNVPDDGVVGPATWAAFGDAGLDLSALATPPPDGDETPATSGATESLASAGVAEAMAASGDAEVLTSSRDDGVPGMSTSLRHTAGRVGTDEISAYEVVAELLKRTRNTPTAVRARSTWAPRLRAPSVSGSANGLPACGRSSTRRCWPT